MSDNEDMVCICPKCGFISFSLPLMTCSTCNCSLINTNITVDEYLNWDDSEQARWEVETIKQYAPQAVDALEEAEEKLQTSLLDFMMCICPKCGTIGFALPGRTCSYCKCEFVFSDVTLDEYVEWNDEEQARWEADLTASQASTISQEAIQHREEQRQSWERLKDLMNRPSTPPIPETFDPPAETHIHITFDSPKPSKGFGGWFGRKKSDSGGSNSGGFTSGGGSRGGGAGRKK